MTTSDSSQDHLVSNHAEYPFNLAEGRGREFLDDLQLPIPAVSVDSAKDTRGEEGHTDHSWNEEVNVANIPRHNADWLNN